MSDQDDAPTRGLTAPLTHAAGPVGTRLQPGEMLSGRYRIVSFIAQGGMGEVYEAEDAELREPVALKVIRPDIAREERNVQRFKREILLARKVTHPNVCRIFDLGIERRETGDITFLTMELLRGETLLDHLKRVGPLPTPDALPIAEQMAAALGAAHRAGVVHRDFKSGNVMLVREAEAIRAVVTDFGLARSGASEGDETRESGGGLIAGTPAYMAPEQVEGRAATLSSDIYGLGIVLYEMVTGVTPFRGDSPLAVAARRLSEPPPPPRTHRPDLDPRWDAAILRCLARDPNRRFARAEDVAAALLPAPVRNPSPVRRKAVVFALAGATLVIGAVAFRTWERPVPGPAPAQGPVTAARRSVAFLGFKNLGGLPENAWLSTALSEMLSTELAAGERLRPIPGENVARMKLDMALPETDAYAPDSLARIRRHLGSDLVVVGSYLAREQNGSLRIDVRVQDALGGHTLVTLSETGSVSDLLLVVTRTGQRLRQHLGLGELPADAARARDGARPRTSEAARLHAQGLRHLRLFEAQAARAPLEEAIRIDPRFAQAHSALAEAWATLGYDQKAREAAREAAALASSLPREERLFVEGRAAEMAREWTKAAATYRTLTEFFPDNVEYTLRLASVLTASGKGTDALVLTEAARRGPSGLDPRLDVAEAEAAESVSDFKREEAAAARAIEQAETAGARLISARARLSRAWARRNLGNSAGATADAQEARALYTATGDRAGAARAINSAATVLYAQGDYEGAKRLYQEALLTFRAIGDQRGMATSLNNMGVAHRDQGHYEDARRVYAESLRIRRAAGDVRGVAGSLNNIALILWQEGDLTEARAMFEEAIPKFAEAGDRSGGSLALNNLGAVLYTQGKLPEARARYEEALAGLRASGNRSGEALSLVTIGALLRATGDLVAARPRLDDALMLSKQLGNKTLAGYSHFNLAEVHLAGDDLAEARRHYEEASRYWAEVKEASEPSARVGLAAVDIEQGRPAEAEAPCRAAAAVFRKAGRVDAEVGALDVLVRALLAQGRAPAARREMRRALELAERSEEGAVRLAVRITHARVEAASGRGEEAKAILQSVITEATRIGLAPLVLEARLALAEQERAEKTPRAAESARALQEDAAAAGQRLVARRAEALGSR